VNAQQIGEIFAGARTRAVVRWASIVVFSALAWTAAHAETPEEWVRLGTRIHGGFGAFIPVGIRIGIDALERLQARPRELSVLYLDGERTPCPCIADGIMMATTASPGQGTLQISAEKAPPGLMGLAIIRHRKTGRALRYEIPAEFAPKLLEWNKTLDALGRYDAVMKAAEPFRVILLEN